MGRPHPVLVEIAAGRDAPAFFEDIPWLLASAQEHRMAGLLARAVAEDPRNMTTAQLTRLATFNLSVKAHHQRLWRGLEEVARTLQPTGIEVASFKGITAEARWYEGIGDRPSVDIDLLLSPHQLDRIDDVIAIFQPDHRLAQSAHVLADLGYLQHVDLRWRDSISIDLHFDVLKVLVWGRSAEEIWRRTTDLTIAGRDPVRVIDAETSLIQSLLHMTKDRFPYLLGFVEVVRIVEHEGLDWDFIDRFVHDEGLEATTYLALESVYRALELPLPASAPTVRGWRRPAWFVLWGPRTQLQGRAGRLTRHRRQFWIPTLARGRFLEGLRRLGRLAFPPEALMDHYHPNSRGPYLWRLISGRRLRSSQRKRRSTNVGRVM
jgi:hypothetical protein